VQVKVDHHQQTLLLMSLLLLLLLLLGLHLKSTMLPLALRCAFMPSNTDWP
jgi:hypothetical protein